jgi:hypothetical protein
MVNFHLTTKAQRPGAREATIATATLPPGSLQRMVRHNLLTRQSQKLLIRAPKINVRADRNHDASLR